MKDHNGLSTRDRIVHEFYKLMLKQGYKETTLRQVANACGISKGNLGFHFKKKEELIIVISRATYLRAYQVVQANVTGIDDAILMFLLHRLLLFYVGSRRKEMFLFLAEMFENDTYMDWRANATYQDLAAAFVRQELAFDANVLRDACVFASFGIYGMINRLYVQGKVFDFERYSKMFLHSVFRQARFEQGDVYIDRAFQIFSTLNVDQLLPELHLGDITLLQYDDASKIGYSEWV